MRWADEEFSERIEAAEAETRTEHVKWSDEKRAKMADLPMDLWRDDEIVDAMRGGELVADFTQPSTPPDCCANCGEELELVSPDETGMSKQYENALEVTLSGGYGMFIDVLFDSDPRVFLCHECAHTACEELPWLNKLLAPERAHSHYPEYWKTHPEHDGWDKNDYYDATGTWIYSTHHSTQDR